MQMYRRQTEGKSIYQGRSWRLRVNRAKKSAEVIVLEGKRDANRYRIGLTNKEGLNVNLQEIRLGKLSQPSLKVNYGQLKRCKELLIDDLRTAEYVTRTLGGVRGALRQLLAEPSTRLQEAFYLSVLIGIRFAFSILDFIIIFFRTLLNFYYSLLVFTGSILGVSDILTGIAGSLLLIYYVLLGFSGLIIEFTD